jgi:hypothetical protein
MISNENKSWWVRAGAAAESSFAGPVFGSGCAVIANPAKFENPYSHDLFMMIPADLKTVRTQFRTADRYGISPRTAITINKKDIERYERLYPHIVIIFDIDIPEFKSTRYAALREVRKAINAGMAKLHVYQHRVGDVMGNVLDATWFPEIGEKH